MIPGNVSSVIRQSPFQMPQFTQPSAASSAQLVPALDESIAQAKQNLRAIGDTGLGTLWRLVDADNRDIVAMPVASAVRSIMLNHWYHHRGQLSVYLRELGVPLPSIYGPSADENPFAIGSAAASA
jgi:uncharacterized damage-inducible protein DinB